MKVSIPNLESFCIEALTKVGVNKDWKHPKDPDARIAKMKDGRTRMAYKSEHSVDMDTQAIVAISIDHADKGDTATGPESLIEAQGNIMEVHGNNVTQEVVADKVYHSNQFLPRSLDVGQKFLLSKSSVKWW
jgi:transposase